MPAPHTQDACPTQDARPTHTRCPLQHNKIAGRMPRLPSQMKEQKLKISRRNLPHWELDGSVYFITFQTWKWQELTSEARQVVLDTCKFFDNRRYKIFCLVVMPDHVHLLMQPLPKSECEFWSLSSIMHSIKSYSAQQIAKVMKHIGTVWQDERYDRIMRDSKEFQNTWEYIRQNPVKANLSATPEEYPFFWQIFA